MPHIRIISVTQSHVCTKFQNTEECRLLHSDPACCPQQRHSSPSRIWSIHFTNVMGIPKRLLSDRGAPTTRTLGRKQTATGECDMSTRGHARVLFTLEHQTDNGTRGVSQQVSASHTHEELATLNNFRTSADRKMEMNTYPPPHTFL